MPPRFFTSHVSKRSFNVAKPLLKVRSGPYTIVIRSSVPGFTLDVTYHLTAAERPSAITIAKLPIYISLGVPEIWRCDGEKLTMYHLQDDRYVLVSASLGLPILNAEILMEFLNLLRKDGESSAIRAFDDWLGRLPSNQEQK